MVLLIIFILHAGFIKKCSYTQGPDLSNAVYTTTALMLRSMT
jgi:hypothetical protein